MIRMFSGCMRAKDTFCNDKEEFLITNNSSHLNVSMENSVSVHVVHSLHQLIHVVLDSVLSNIVTSSTDKLSVGNVIQA